MAQLGITPELVLRLMDTNHRGWLAEADGEVVGFAMGDKSTGGMWVTAVVKEIEAQRTGGALMKRMDEWLRSEGWQEIRLSTDADESDRAAGFYRRLGWDDREIEDGGRFM